MANEEGFNLNMPPLRVTDPIRFKEVGAHFAGAPYPRLVYKPTAPLEWRRLATEAELAQAKRDGYTAMAPPDFTKRATEPDPEPEPSPDLPPRRPGRPRKEPLVAA